MKLQEDEGSRLQRLKIETTVVEQHNEKLEEKKKENVPDGLAAGAADTSSDAEVNDVA